MDHFYKLKSSGKPWRDHRMIATPRYPKRIARNRLKEIIKSPRIRQVVGGGFAFILIIIDSILVLSM